MTAYRIEKQSNYTVVDNEFIRDNRISFKAKGILLYLLSRPDNWQVYEADIVKQSSDGIRAVRSGIKELIDAGYIERNQKRDEKNRFMGYEYVVREKSPLLRFAKTGNSMLISTDKVNTENNENNGSNSVESHREKCKFNPLIMTFMNWYKDLYLSARGTKHPRLKMDQIKRIHDTLLDFSTYWDLDIPDDLQVMAQSFFEHVHDTDYNLNHFATEGILEVRFYDSGLYAG